jgi:CDP-glycerol glycerophosphotransferase
MQSIFEPSGRKQEARMLGVLIRNAKNLILGWGLCVPLSLLVPKKKNLVLFMGRFGGEFLDNVKYLYLYLHSLEKNNVEYYFFTENKSVYKTLKANNLPALYHPTLSSIRALLRANVIVASSTVWIKKCKYHLLFRSKKVQLFHGVALKKIELGIPQKAEYNNSLTGKLDNGIRGRFPLYDVCISTSEYCTENLFAKSFRAKTFLESGYPRNDFLLNSQDDKYALLESDQKTLSAINSLRAKGYKTILYAPTFRNVISDAVSDGALNLDELFKFAVKNKVVFVFKLHMSSGIKNKLQECENILNYDSSKDIQPIMKISDVLITDYSSAYIDYLLLDRPVVFFPYDYEKYTQTDRDMSFDYEWVTAGPKCHSQKELHQAIKEALEQEEQLIEKRRQIKDLFFKYKDGNASKRVWNFIEKEFITG